MKYRSFLAVTLRDSIPSGKRDDVLNKALFRSTVSFRIVETAGRGS
jgi:hypothetical protein